MKRGRDHGPEAMRTEREHCRSGHASEVDRQMPHVERRKFHRNILVQDPVRAHQAKRDCGHCALGTATTPGGKSKRSQPEGQKQGGSHRDFFTLWLLPGQYSFMRRTDAVAPPTGRPRDNSETWTETGREGEVRNGST